MRLRAHFLSKLLFGIKLACLPRLISIFERSELDTRAKKSRENERSQRSLYFAENF